MNGSKESAEGHSSGAGEMAHTLAMGYILTNTTAGDDKEVDEVTDMFADLAKKVRLHTNYKAYQLANMDTRRRRSRARRRRARKKTAPRATLLLSRKRRSLARRRLRTTLKLSLLPPVETSPKARRRLPLPNPKYKKGI